MALRTRRTRALLILAVILAVASFAYSMLHEWPSNQRVFVYTPNELSAENSGAPQLHFQFLDIVSALNDPDVYCSSRLLVWPNAKDGQTVMSGYEGYEYCARAETEWDHFVAKFEVFKKFVDEEQKLLRQQRIDVVALALVRWLAVLFLVIGTMSVFRWIESGSSKGKG